MKSKYVSKAKHVYLEKSAHSAYSKTHHFPTEKKDEFAKYICEHIIQEKSEQCRKLRILDAGIGTGNDILVPFIKNINRLYPDLMIEIVGFDNSYSMLMAGEQSLFQNLKKLDGKLEFIKKKHEIKWINKNTKLNVFNFDIEKEILFFENNEFDIVFSFFFLHHFTKWRS